MANKRVGVMIRVRVAFAVRVTATVAVDYEVKVRLTCRVRVRPPDVAGELVSAPGSPDATALAREAT